MVASNSCFGIRGARRRRALSISVRLSKRASLWRLLEIPQIRRRLVLAGGQQLAVGAFEIDLVADLGQERDLGTIFLAPDRILLGAAPVALQRVPRPCER